MHSSRAQGALEYLLLIGGGVLVATVILIIALNTAPQGNVILSAGINSYLQHVSLNGGGGGPPGNDTGVPNYNLTLQPGDGQMSLVVSITDQTYPITYTIIYSTDSVAISGVDTVAEFTTLPGNVFYVDASGTTYTGLLDAVRHPSALNDTFVQTGLTNGILHYYRVLACDGLPAPLCIIGNVFPATPNGGGGGNDNTPPSIASFTAAPGDFVANLTYDVSDNVGVTSISIARSKNNISGVAGFSTSPFAGFDPPLATNIAATSVFSGSSLNVSATFDDEAVANGMRYYYAIRACDAAGNCSIAFSGQVILNVAPITYAFSFGTPETVFDYGGQLPNVPTSCNVNDFPDLVPRAFRDSSNKIVLYGVNAPDNYEMVSRFANNFTVTNFQRQCAAPIITSETMPQLNKYASMRWLAAPYTENGTDVFSLIYDEYHDPYFGSPCSLGNPNPGNPCMYMSTGLATSTNGGDTYTMAATPNHVVATVSTDWNPTLNYTGPGTEPVYGVAIPTNIVKNNGQYYSIVSEITQPSSAQHRGNCVMRTSDLSSPTSWRFYDGSLTIGPKANWYDSVFTVTSTPIVGHTECGFIDLPSTHSTTGTVTFNTYMNRYFFVGAGPSTGDCHFYYMTSKDLIHWTPPQVFKDTPNGPGCSLFQNSEMYPAIIDHSDASRNFEYSDQSAWLYYVKMIDSALDRDLERVSFTIT